MKTLITGAAGFIGSHFLHEYFENWINKGFLGDILVVDKLTYAARLENLEPSLGKSQIEFIKGDIGDNSFVDLVCREVDIVINFAAETHVDNSIRNSNDFIQTNIVGTHNLLVASLKYDIKYFIQISTDEVYGSVAMGESKEGDRLMPSSPYSASKAAADLLVESFANTYGLKTLITRSCNNFGPNQHSEKFIPTAIHSILRGKPIPIYGTGENQREWIFVRDNCKAILGLIEKGVEGTINIGSGVRCSNIEIVEKLQKLLPEYETRYDFVKDRLGHDFRYAVNNHELMSNIKIIFTDFEAALKDTVFNYQERIEN